MKKRWATEAAQRCKKDSWWRLAGKRWRPKRLGKPLEQGGALEQVGARIERVMGLTAEVSGLP